MSRHNPAPMVASTDPFAPSSNTNIFAEAASRDAAMGGQQPNAPTNLPAGMPQQPPQQNPVDMQMQQTATSGDSMTGGMQQQQFQQQQQQQGGAPEGNPLDSFVQKTDNTTTPNTDGTPVGTEPVQAPPSPFAASIQDYTNIAAKQSYVNEITPETMQSILSGDANALMTLLNQVGRGAFANAAFASGRVAQSGVNHHMEGFQSKTLPELLRDNSHQQAFESNDHAVLKHPAVAPLVQQQTQQLRNQYPNASPQEIQAKVVEYFSAVAGAFNAMPQQATTEPSPQQQQEAGGLESLFNL